MRISLSLVLELSYTLLLTLLKKLALFSGKGPLLGHVFFPLLGLHEVIHLVLNDLPWSCAQVHLGVHVINPHLCDLGGLVRNQSPYCVKKFQEFDSLVGHLALGNYVMSHGVDWPGDLCQPHLDVVEVGFRFFDCLTGFVIDLWGFILHGLVFQKFLKFSSMEGMNAISSWYASSSIGCFLALTCGPSGTFEVDAITAGAIGGGAPAGGTFEVDANAVTFASIAC
ncbi:hypothetical protein AX774_g7696 [Zancudomyces culisetae]|uniref:Uncharacterized protein n=1 Tax=Zancudomyces culisetae TaxID=1213189 RepID=A0A1R1PDA7_ZANCU|nr:hypothetical protein AX774_g7696 [Zancudomyces culisetae]|eukprot:OMH78899.1 hypothetical protein AX774_g7696 [Zancudomyces culisetae]